MTTAAESGMPADAAASGRAEAGGLLDEAAFQRLHGETARPLWGYLYRVLGDGSDADDLMQEAYLRMLRAPVANLPADEQRAYLFRIAGNLAVDRYRKRKRDAELHGAIERDAPRSAAPAARDLDVARTFGALTPQERALLWLAYVEGSAHQEIAASLRIKPASVRVLLFRARRRLRDLIARAASGVGR